MYNSNEVSDRIKAYTKEKGLTVKGILLNAGLSDNLMSGMKNSMPKSENLAKIADELDCSVDYLLGRTDCPAVATDLDEQDVKLLNIFKRLSPDAKKLLMERIDSAVGEE